MVYNGRFTALLVQFLSALSQRRTGELSFLGQELLSSVAESGDYAGSVRLGEALEGLVKELAPWIRGEAWTGAGPGGKADVPVDFIDPQAPGGVRYELDATSGPELSAILDDLRHAGQHRARGAEPPTRLLFEGPPGCGKTQGAVWLAGGLSKKLAVIMLSKLISKWIGETGARFLAAVDAARDAGAVLLIDELDAVGSHRTEGGNEGDRHAVQVVGAMNQILEDPKNRDLVIVGATNLADHIDPAVARRLQTRVKFGYPDAATRERIALHHWRLAPLDAGALDAVVSRTDGKSGDALVRACHAANRAAARRGAAAGAALPDDAAELAASLRAAIGDFGDKTLPLEIAIRAASMLAELDKLPIGTEVGKASNARRLLVETARIEVGDVIAAISGLTSEVPLNREPSLLVRPGSRQA